MLRIVAVFIGVAAVAACATTSEPRVAITPSGRPEAIFVGRTPDQVQGLIASGCMDRGHMVVASTPNQVQCEVQMTAMQSALTQALIGNSYSTTPQHFVRFVITPIGSDTRVQAQSWVQTQMAFGQMQTQELNSNQQFNSVQSFLMGIGGVPPGGGAIQGKPEPVTTEPTGEASTDPPA